VIELHVQPTQKFYLPHTENSVWLCVRVVGLESSLPQDGAETARRNIAWVLDRSGSMEGGRLSALRSAVAGAVQSLAPEDIVSVVLFGSEVETVVEAQPSRAAAERITSMKTWESGGGAALFDGLNQAAAQLRRHASGNTISQLVLVTDGEATKGPRERGDFQRLAEGWLREGIGLTVVGLGGGFDEDLLAAMARAGGGKFRYCESPDHLAAVLAEAGNASGIAVAADLVVSIEFRNYWSEVRVRGGLPGEVRRRVATFRVPHLLAGQERVFLTSALLPVQAAGGTARDSVRARARWVDPASGEIQEIVSSVSIRFSSDLRDNDYRLSAAAHRTVTAALLTEGLGEAIDALDRGDRRRLLRSLRDARDATRRLELEGDEPSENPALAAFEAYLAELQAREIGPSERKLLRSGLLGRLQPPPLQEERARPSSYPSQPSSSSKLLYP